MDPLSHAVTGGALAALLSRPSERRVAVCVGILAGMAADLDVLFQSDTDPLLYLDYHRGFTHGLGFVPVGALILTLLFHPVTRRWLTFGRTYLFAFVGWLHHPLLDAATSYGTSLWWPFSDTRVAWSYVAVVDPLYTIPILIALVVFLWKPRAGLAAFAVAWALAYIGLGYVQRERAVTAAFELAHSRGHQPEVVDAKPSIFNNILFRTLYEAEGIYYVDAIRVGYASRAQVFVGDSVAVFDKNAAFPDLDPESRLANDIDRFDVFSMGYLYQAPGDPQLVADLRYSLIPNSIEPLWGIRVDPTQPDEHAPFEVYRDLEESDREHFLNMLLRPGRLKD